MNMKKHKTYLVLSLPPEWQGKPVKKWFKIDEEVRLPGVVWSWEPKGTTSLVVIPAGSEILLPAYEIKVVPPG